MLQSSHTLLASADAFLLAFIPLGIKVNALRTDTNHSTRGQMLYGSHCKSCSSALLHM